MGKTKIMGGLCTVVAAISLTVSAVSASTNYKMLWVQGESVYIDHDTKVSPHHQFIDYYHDGSAPYGAILVTLRNFKLSCPTTSGDFNTRNVSFHVTIQQFRDGKWQKAWDKFGGDVANTKSSTNYLGITQSFPFDRGIVRGKKADYRVMISDNPGGKCSFTGTMDVQGNLQGV